MKPFHINAINAAILIIVGLIGYLGSDTPSVTALIPVFAGVVFLALFKGLKDGNKVIAHIVVLLTFLTLVALFKPLSGAISRDDCGAIIRVAIMIFSGIAAMVVYIKSFIDARKNRV
jgi:hypothetical protein